MAQTRLRPGDMLARTGGDEFCIVLPSSTLREGAMIARRVLEVCRADCRTVRRQRHPDRGLDRVCAMDRRDRHASRPADRGRDHALYDAKKGGRDGYATYEPKPARAPDMVELLATGLRKRA